MARRPAIHQRRKVKAELDQLHLKHFDAINEGVLDLAVDIMMPLAEDKEVRQLEDWVDRPINV